MRGNCIHDGVVSAAAEPAYSSFCMASHEYERTDVHGCRECLEVHATAAMIADVGAIKQMLQNVIPKVQAGQTVAQLRQLWPEAVKQPGSTGLWWDVR